jgi:hypothetical protein
VSNTHWRKLTTWSLFGLAWAALMMARIRPFRTSCGIESACLSYVTVSAVSISKRCTVNIYSNKISNLSCYVHAGVFVRSTTGAWARGFGAWRCRSFVPSTLARHPCQAPVPDTSTNSMRTPHANSPAFYVGLPSLLL